jgi:hypothetical protein
MNGHLGFQAIQVSTHFSIFSTIITHTGELVTPNIIHPHSETSHMKVKERHSF